MVTTTTIKKERLAYRQHVAAKYKKELRKRATPQERQVYSILKVLYPKVVFQKSFLTGDRIIIVDFYIPEKGIVVEVDGSHHYKGEQLKQDKKRDSYLKSRGIKVFRVKNKEINNIDWKVLIETLKQLK